MVNNLKFLTLKQFFFHFPNIFEKATSRLLLLELFEAKSVKVLWKYVDVLESAWKWKHFRT